MAYRIGANGQVVIPKHLRDELNLTPGSEVDFERDGEAIRLFASGAAATRGLRGRYASSGMAQSLLEARSAESG